MTNVWAKWESQVVNGVFPLRRFLGNSDHSVVFLTEYTALNMADAAIKLVPAHPVLADVQLAHWKTVCGLSHAHLIRLLDAGRCQLGGHPFLFAVMEYADQNLAQVLPHRALTPDELLEILHPSLDALTFLHDKRLVHGQLKPPNFLVVNDQLKLASDNVRPAGESIASTAKPSPYDAPEAREVGVLAASDIWGLGVTMVEALTQRPPIFPDEQTPTVALPTTLAPELAHAIRRCLNRDPRSRAGIADLQDAINPPPKPPPDSDPRLAQSAVSGDRPSEQILKSPSTRSSMGPAVALGLVVIIAAWTGVRLLRTPSSSHAPVLTTSEPSPQQGPPPAAVPRNTSTPAPASSTVLHQAIPDVPRSARESIHGHIRVTVRVNVDSSGNVVAETVQIPGSSKYFAHLAAEAASQWKFTPVENVASRVWLLHFEFTRDGTTGHAAPR